MASVRDRLQSSMALPASVRPLRIAHFDAIAFTALGALECLLRHALGLPTAELTDLGNAGQRGSSHGLKWTALPVRADS